MSNVTSVKPRIPKDLIRGLYIPEFIPKDVNLNDLVREGVVVEKAEAAKTTVASKIANPTPAKIPIPITDTEADEADHQLLNTALRIQATKQKLTNVRNALDQAILTSNGGKELGFTMDVSKKPRVKRALRKLFGVKTNTITHSMYIEMLKAKSEIEKQEVSDYSKGKTR